MLILHYKILVPRFISEEYNKPYILSIYLFPTYYQCFYSNPSAHTRLFSSRHIQTLVLCGCSHFDKQSAFCLYASETDNFSKGITFSFNPYFIQFRIFGAHNCFQSPTPAGSIITFQFPRRFIVLRPSMLVIADWAFRNVKGYKRAIIKVVSLKQVFILFIICSRS